MKFLKEFILKGEKDSKLPEQVQKVDSFYIYYKEGEYEGIILRKSNQLDQAFEDENWAIFKSKIKEVRK